MPTHTNFFIFTFLQKEAGGNRIDLVILHICSSWKLDAAHFFPIPLSYLTITPGFGFKSLTIILKRQTCESSVEICVECSPEYIQSDVRKACVHVTVNGQNHRV